MKIKYWEVSNNPFQLHPIQFIFSPPLPPQQSPPCPLTSRSLPQPSQISPSHLLLSSIPPAWGFKGLKITAPMPFTGKQDETESFIHSCILYINSRLLEFGTEQNKVIWILSHMQTRAAHAWHDYIMAQIFKCTLWFHTADDLLKEIKWKFCGTNKHTTTSSKIQTIMQENYMADVQDFKKAALEAGYEGYPIIVEFKGSLHPVLRWRLAEI